LRLGHQGKWRRQQGKISWISSSEGTQVTFDVTFTGNEKNQFMYIAFTYPFSYEDCSQYFDNVQEKIKK
jgi:hypothetical protein